MISRKEIMINIFIKEFSLKDLSSLRDDWEILQNGDDMTYYQSYEWYKNIIMKFNIKDSNLYFTKFFIAYKEDIPIMIAPLFFIKRNIHIINKKGVYFLDEHGWSDYGNFIYKKFSNEAFNSIIRYIVKCYGIKYFYLNRIRSNSDIYMYIKNKKELTKSSITPTVELSLPENTDNYSKILSKHARQNIRTAYNRVKSDNLWFDLNYEEKDIDINKCKNLREIRLNDIQRKESQSHSYFFSLYKEIRDKIKIKFPKYLVIEEDKNSKFMTISYKGELLAFFNYGLDYTHKKIVIMAAGTNIEFKRYSPGLILMHSFIINEINNKNSVIDFIDFTRGNESYKYELGGNMNLIYDIKLDYNNSHIHRLHIKINEIIIKYIKKVLF